MEPLVEPEKLVTNVLLYVVNARTNMNLHMTANNDVFVHDTTSTSDQWLLIREGQTEWYRIRNFRTSLDLHMDASNNAVGWSGDMDSNLWRFRQAGPPYESGTYVIENQRTGLPLHTAANNDVRGYPVGEAGSNQWRLVVAGSVQLVHITYDIAEKLESIAPATLTRLVFNNNTDAELHPTWQENYAVTVRDEHTFTWNFGYSFSSTITCEVSALVSSVSTSITQTFSIAVGTSNTSEKTISQSQSFALPTVVQPRRRVEVTVLTRKATISAPYTARFRSGQVEWTHRGVYHGVQCSVLEVDVQDVGPAIANAPEVIVQE